MALVTVTALKLPWAWMLLASLVMFSWETRFLPHPSASSPYPSSPWLLAENFASHFTEDTEALEVRFPFSAPSPSPGIPHPPPSWADHAACLLSWYHQAFTFFWATLIHPQHAPGSLTLQHPSQWPVSTPAMVPSLCFSPQSMPLKKWTVKVFPLQPGPGNLCHQDHHPGQQIPL